MKEKFNKVNVMDLEDKCKQIKINIIDTKDSGKMTVKMGLEYCFNKTEKFKLVTLKMINVRAMELNTIATISVKKVNSKTTLVRDLELYTTIIIANLKVYSTTGSLMVRVYSTMGIYCMMKCGKMESSSAEYYVNENS